MTGTIFLIENHVDIEEIKNSISYYKNSKIFSLSYPAYKNLIKNQISNEIGEDYLTVEDRKNIDDSAINTTITWHDHSSIKDLFFLDGHNLATLIEMELLQYFARIYGNAMTIVKIIEKEEPNLIIAYTQLNDFIQRICKQKNIQVILHDEIEQSSLLFDKMNIKYNLGSHPLSITISRSRYLKIKKFVEKIINSIFRLNPNFKLAQKKSILLIDFNPTQYDVLIKELSASDKNILLLNQRRPAVWNLESLKIILNSKCKIIHLDHFAKKIETKLLQELDILSDNLKKIWSLDSVFEETFSINSHTFWHSIKNSFMQICDKRFSESVRRILLLNELFDKFNISVILEWAETGQEEKEIISISKKRGIKSVMLQHAMDPTSSKWDKFHKFALGGYSFFISDKQAFWGEVAKNRALFYGHKEENLLVTGSPRHDNFFKVVKNAQNKGIILFATTSVTGRISFEQTPFESYVKFDNFVREVCRVVKKFTDKQLIVKPHPQPDFLSNITELIKEIDPNIPIIYNANLVELINSCDILITFNNSTIALESMILNKPAISLQIEKWAEEDEIVKTGALLSITNINDIESGIKKLLCDKEFKDKTQQNSRKFIESYFVNKGHASETLAKILDRF